MTPSVRPFRFTCTSFSFPLLDVERVARLLQLLEFAHIDLCIADGSREVAASDVEADPEPAARRHRSACDAAGLRVVDVFCHLGSTAFDRPLNTPDARLRARNRARFQADVRYAGRVGADGLTVSPGRRFEDIADGGFDLACTELTRYARWAQASGLRLSVEPHLDSIASAPDAAASLVENVEGLSLTVDYSHFVAQGIDPSTVHALLPLTGHVHVRQAAPGRLQTGADEGVIEFDPILDRLADCGYRGALALEYVWNRWQDMNRVDVVAETLLLRRRLADHLTVIEARRIGR